LTARDRLRLSLAAALAIGVVAIVQQTLISASNFGGTDEWLLLDLSSRGVLGVPYANRPLVLFWQAPAARLWPGSLAAFWAFAGLYRLAAGLVTAALAWRLAPGTPRLALVAGTCAVAWTPLDRLRLDTVLICGYEGATFATFAAVLLWVASWQRRSPMLLVAACLFGGVAALTVESALVVLAIAPFLAWDTRARAERGRLLAWSAVWEAAVALAFLHAVAPLFGRQPSYQTGAIGLDPAPLHVLSRLAQLLGRQFLPLFEPGAAQLERVAVALATLAFVAGHALVPVRCETEGGAGTRPLLRVLAAGLLLATSAHAAMALSSRIENPARTQILPGPGFGLALAAAVMLLARALRSRWRALLPALAGAWVVAVGTGRIAAMQREWDAFRSAFTAQAATLSRLTAVAPALRPGTLVVLLDAGPAWPMTFTFAHALRFLYGDGVVGLVDGADDFLYSSAFTSAGVVLSPWPVIRHEWQVQPGLYGWDRIVVASGGNGRPLTVLPRWPAERLPPLPPGASYSPLARVESVPVRQEQRRVLAAWRLWPPDAAIARGGREDQ
jgi:hypothetical protein